MTKTYQEVMHQIQSLSREAEQLKRKETQEVVARIKEAIALYNITAVDLGLRSEARAAGSRRTLDDAPIRRSKSKAKVNLVPKYGDAAGNTWVGRGPRPLWLRRALANGKELSDFAI